jgi:hypothetical protein
VKFWWGNLKEKYHLEGLGVRWADIIKMKLVCGGVLMGKPKEKTPLRRSRR